MERRVKNIGFLSILVIATYLPISIFYFLKLPGVDSVEIRIGVFSKIIEILFFLVCLFFYLMGSTRATLSLLGFLGSIIFTLFDFLVVPLIHENGNLLMVFSEVTALFISCVAFYQLIRSLDVKKIESQFSEETPIKTTIGLLLAVALISSYAAYLYYKVYLVGPYILGLEPDHPIYNIIRAFPILFPLLLVYLLLFKKDWRYVLTSAFLVFNAVSFAADFSVLVFTGFGYTYLIESIPSFLLLSFAVIFLKSLHEGDASMKSGRSGSGC